MIYNVAIGYGWVKTLYFAVVELNPDEVEKYAKQITDILIEKYAKVYANPRVDKDNTIGIEYIIARSDNPCGNIAYFLMCSIWPKKDTAATDKLHDINDVLNEIRNIEIPTEPYIMPNSVIYDVLRRCKEKEESKQRGGGK